MPQLTAHEVKQLAVRLDEARRTVTGVTKITDDYPDLEHADAYEVQDALWRLHEARGERLVGLKMGLTSRAKMAQMGVDAPICGFLTHAHVAHDGAPIDTAQLIHPKVEPEIAFVTKRDLRGPGCTVAEVLAATDFVLGALEVIDSRYEAFRFDLVSVIADNTSASRFVLAGTRAAPGGLDLRTLGVVLERNGEVVQTGAGAAVLGHPAVSVATLADMLWTRGRIIPAGTLVLTGGLTAAVPVAAGDAIHVSFAGLGELTARFS